MVTVGWQWSFQVTTASCNSPSSRPSQLSHSKKSDFSACSSMVQRSDLVIRLLQIAHLGFRNAFEQQAWPVSHDHEFSYSSFKPIHSSQSC